MEFLSESSEGECSDTNDEFTDSTNSNTELSGDDKKLKFIMEARIRGRRGCERSVVCQDNIDALKWRARLSLEAAIAERERLITEIENTAQKAHIGGLVKQWLSEEVDPILIIDDEVLYTDWCPDSVLAMFGKRGDKQIIGLELLSIGVGVSTFQQKLAGKHIMLAKERRSEIFRPFANLPQFMDNVLEIRCVSFHRQGPEFVKFGGPAVAKRVWVDERDRRYLGRANVE